MSSIAGSVLTLAEGQEHGRVGVVGAEQAIRMATEVAARSAGIEDVCGLILPGRHADLVVLAPDLSLRETYVGGVGLGLRHGPTEHKGDGDFRAVAGPGFVLP